MNNTTSLLLSTVSSKPQPPKTLHPAVHVSFCVIAAASFIFNLSFCIVLLRKPSMLKKSHNILLFSLAVVDLLTGVFLVATPGYAIPKSAYPVPPGLGGEIFLPPARKQISSVCNGKSLHPSCCLPCYRAMVLRA
ncbi:hypothetical protein OS493_022705 [Desmophyllum pertusum]|uniref:G-protein coupled receptors family 1 profile domain-containing protein n=1 Tax=Desmophyllum pertusum TaxID=174260 RepID=A0A9W9YC91_9CNID|nr:hypothetical protein OS493_022705 [Desmophyllum pertusum]